MRLSDKRNDAPIPYRDSKLTRLLKHSLEGKSKVMIVCNIAPYSDMYEESLSTLKFAQRAKKITHAVKKNEVIDTGLLLKKYEEEIVTLQLRIGEMEKMLNSKGQEVFKKEIGTLEEKILNMEDEKGRRDKEFNSLLKEKLKYEEELRKLKSFIISSDTVQQSDEDLGTKKKARYAAMKQTFTGGMLLCDDIDSEEDTMDRRESLLIDRIENITQILAAEDPLQSFEEPPIEKLSRTELLDLINTQKTTISTLEKRLTQKEQEVLELNDELGVYKENLHNHLRLLKS